MSGKGGNKVGHIQRVGAQGIGRCLGAIRWVTYRVALSGREAIRWVIQGGRRIGNAWGGGNKMGRGQ